MEAEKRIAILIDADNISDKYIKIILEETAKSGIATYKRIYGDWTNPQLASWKAVLLDNSIIPIQQYSYTKGKSSTDSAMIIDAMDILYSGTVDGFCIVSSDSDFTRLVARLREAGKYVVGMGESKTPKPFISACNQFKYLDLLAKSADKPEISKEIKQSRNNTEQKHFRRVIRNIAMECSDDDGWIFSAELKNQLTKRYPDFDERNFGFIKFTPFVESLGVFEVRRERTSAGNNVQLVYFRVKQ